MIHVGSDAYSAQPLHEDGFCDLANWRQLETYGQWQSDSHGLIGRWLSDSPSLFFRHRIEGEFLWQVTARRLRPSDEDVARMHQNKHWHDAQPLEKYNYNFWLRAQDPDGRDFCEVYPTKLGTGWNGMGDDYWRSLFSTVVWNPDSHWVRLRRSPGYVKERDVQDVVPFQPYDMPHRFTFVVRNKGVRMYWDDHRVYDWKGEVPASGYIGLCVWLCTVRFESMRLYRLH